MVSGAYAAEYGQREDIDEAMKKVQVRRREANNWVQKSEATAYQEHMETPFFIVEEKLHHCALLLHA